MAIEIVDFPIKKIVIFHSYVKLPEGKPPFSYGFPMGFPIFPWFSHHQKNTSGRQRWRQRSSWLAPESLTTWRRGERSSCLFMFPIVEGLTPCSEEIGIDWMMGVPLVIIHFRLGFSMQYHEININKPTSELRIPPYFVICCPFKGQMNSLVI